MSGPESIAPKEQLKLLKASELVVLLGYAGPASNLRVRIHFKSGAVREGIVKWHDDRISNGPAIVISDQKNKFNEELIPLGGHTVYQSPPRISSSDPARARPVAFGKVSAHKVPINPKVEGILFEVINEE